MKRADLPVVIKLMTTGRTVQSLSTRATYIIPSIHRDMGPLELELVQIFRTLGLIRLWFSGSARA